MTCINVLEFFFFFFQRTAHVCFPFVIYIYIGLKILLKIQSIGFYSGDIGGVHIFLDGGIKLCSLVFGVN
jgi:hypothetical protein